MNIVQKTLPVTRGWVQARNIEEFLRLYKEGRKVFFQCDTPFDRNSEPDTVQVCGSVEGVFIDNLDCEKGCGYLDEFLQQCYPQVREALKVKSNVIENIAATLRATRP